MEIYEVTYSVDNLNVKGYLGLPETSGETSEEISETVRRATGAQSLLPVRNVPYDPVNPSTDRPNSTNQSASAASTPTRFPALLYCRGGINSVGMSRLEWIETFCDLGFVVFAPWYRGTLQTDGRDEFGGADVSDTVAGFRILQQMSCVDEAQITVLGFSRGSINAIRTVIEQPSANALVLWGGVADLAATYEERVDLRKMLRRVIGGTPKKVPQAYRTRSPIYYAKDVPCPVLVIHSTADPQVDFHHGQDMYHALGEAGIAAWWQGYQGYAHHFDPFIRQAVIERMLEWAQKTRG